MPTALTVIAAIRELSAHELDRFAELTARDTPMFRMILEKTDFWKNMKAAIDKVEGHIAEKLYEYMTEIGDLREKIFKRTPKARFTERDSEIVRLRDEVLPDGKQRSFGQICQLIEKKWPTTQNGTPLNAAAVCGAYNRRKSEPN